MKSLIEAMLGIEAPTAGQENAWRIAFPSAWPAWATVLALAAVVTLAAWLYRREAEHLPVGRRRLLAGLRVAAFAIALWVLFEPVLLVDTTNVRSNNVCVIVDESLSMGVTDRYAAPDVQAAVSRVLEAGGPNSSAIEPAKATRLDLARAVLTREQGRLLRTLGAKHKVSVYAAGAGRARLVEKLHHPDDVAETLKRLTELQPAGGATRLGEAVRTALNDLRGQSVTGLIVLSDGQNNSGLSLEEATAYARRKGTRVFTVGLGNPAQAKDLKLQGLLVDDMVFIDDLVVFRAEVVGRGYKGQRVQARLKRADDPTVLATAAVEIGDDDQPVPVQLTYRPKREGKGQYQVEVVPLPDEARTENKSLSHSVRVIKEPIRVLYVETYPRYEYRYLKNLLMRDKTIEVSCLLLGADAEFPQEGDTPVHMFPTDRKGLDPYAVVIFGDVNPVLLTGDQLAAVARFTQEGGGFLMIAGEYYAPGEFRDTPVARILPVEIGAVGSLGYGTRVSEEEFRPELTLEGRTSPIFQFASGQRESLDIWRNLPGFFWFAPVARAKPAASVLAVHPTAVGSDGKRPIFVSQFVGAGRSMFNAVDSTWRWRWRMGDAYFGKFWVQAIRFLARTKLLGKTKMVHVLTDRREYSLGDSVRVQVRILNKALEPTDRGQVLAYAANASHGRREVVLKPAPGGRGLYEGLFVPPGVGDYRIQPQLALLGANASTAEFEVRPPQVEFEDVRLDELALGAMAEATGGDYYSVVAGPDGKGLAQTDEIASRIPGGPQITVHTTSRRLWDLPVVLIVFVAILVIEWILRKRASLL